MPELQCQDKIRVLLKAGISCQGDNLTNYLKTQTEVPDWQRAWFGNDEVTKKFWQVLIELQSELVPQYISYSELYTIFWNLFKEVVINREQFQSRRKLEQRIDNFATIVKKPLTEFDVMYEIKNLDIGSKDFTAGNVDILKINQEFFDDYPIKKHEIFGKLLDTWEGKIVAKVAIKAAEAQGANMLGRIEIDRALNVLLMGVRKEYIGRSSDSLFLWEVGPSLILPKTVSDKGYTFSIFGNMENYPFIADIGDIFTKIIDEKSIWTQVLNAKLPKDIQMRLEMAIEWVSLAIKEYSNDHKLIHLCTALEVLLLPEHTTGTKGEFIALRQALVGQNIFQAPTSILRLYEKRGDIIHGGKLNITLYEEYVHLLDCCLRVITKLIYLSKEFPDANTLKELLGKVENRETLEKFIKHCEWGMIKGKKINDIKKVAARLLEKY
jgi:hypothetical protein